MRKYEPEPIISFGEACEKMYQMCWFDPEPVKMTWRDVEVVMRKIMVPPKQ